MKKPLFQSTLISKLAATSALLAAILVLVSVYFFDMFSGQLIKESFKSPLEEWSVLVASRIAKYPHMAHNVPLNHGIGIIVITPEKSYAYAPDGSESDIATLLSDSSDYRTIEVPGHNGTKTIFLLTDEQLSGNNKYILWYLLAFILVIIGAVYIVQVSLLKPLVWLRSGVDYVANGDFSRKVPVVRNDEIGQIAKAFNKMVQQVQAMIHDREQLLADVSHELRSPLARIKVALALLPEHDKLSTISRDIKEMETLISQLLEREQIKHVFEQRQQVPIDLKIIVEQTLVQFVHAEPPILLELAHDALIIKGDERLLKILLHNLLENAIKYSMLDSSPINILIDKDDDHLTIKVIDDGMGIDCKNQEEVFKPFVKLSNDRGHRSGYGLGLNICQRIVEAHKGTISMASNMPRGTIVIVELPFF